MSRRSAGLLKRLYRVRWLGALALCFPALLLSVTYAWRTYARVDSYRRATGQDAAITRALFQLALFDTLRVDLRRMALPAPPEPSTLPVFSLDIRREDWDLLEASAALDDERAYVNARLEYEGQLHDAQIRLRGARYWHTDLPQKSLKIKVEKGDLVSGYRVFNLINDTTPMVVGEHLILQLAETLGVLTPRSQFARVKINDKDLGVFHYETQPDEALVRTNRRMPGGAYSGDLPASAATHELWDGTSRWTKVASRDASLQEATDMSELARLLDKVTNASHADFASFAAEEMRLEAFASMDVLDVAFGGDQHDFRSNHKYYFDPYRGQWEPIAWNFRGFSSDPRFNLVENPFLLRLKMTPGYLTLRNRMLYEFLMGPGSPAAVRERGTKVFTHLAPELRSDPFWDATTLLPRVDTFHRRMVRPMDLERAVLVFEAELTTYRNRHSQLVTELEKNPLYLLVSEPRKLAGGTLPEGAVGPELRPERYETALTAVLDGHSGVRLRSLQVDFDPDCGDGSFELVADAANRASRVREDGVVTRSRRSGSAEVEGEILLRPGLVLAPREDANERRGNVESRSAPADYGFTLNSTCPPRRVVLEGFHSSTGSRVRSRPASDALRAAVPQHWPGLEAVPKWEPGQLAAHPREFPPALSKQVDLGPGEVQVPETRVFSADTTVRVLPGTQLLMGKSASLVFHGRVHLDGSADEPIVIRAAEGVWGGVALQGRGTEGSSLRHVTVSGGTKVTRGLIPYPAVVNIHDTRDITVEHSRFGDTAGEGDALHVAYVDAFRLSDSEFLNTGGDAADLEFTTADVDRVRFVNIGDDALDLMASNVDVADCIALGIAGNGIGAGEETTATVRSTLIGNAKVGVLAKNASNVWLTGSVLFRNETGVRVYTREVRYQGPSRVRANVLYAVDSSKAPVLREDLAGNRLDQGRILESLPQEGLGDHLRENVLGLDSWGDLDTWVETTQRQAVR